jgi:hydroxymethylpyrimidine pyrophosphatase-like HAD family hydrolase
MQLYHGSTNGSLVRFTDELIDSGSGDRVMGSGVYFSDFPEDCEIYTTDGGAVYRCNVSHAGEMPQYDQPLDQDVFDRLVNALEAFDPHFYETADRERQDYPDQTWDLMNFYNMLRTDHDHLSVANFFAMNADIYGASDSSQGHHIGTIYATWHPILVCVYGQIEPDFY